MNVEADDVLQNVFAQNVLDKPENWTYQPGQDVYVQVAYTDAGDPVRMVVAAQRVEKYRHAPRGRTNA